VSVNSLLISVLLLGLAAPAIAQTIVHQVTAPARTLNPFLVSSSASGQGQGFAWATAQEANYTYLSTQWTVPPYPTVPISSANVPITSLWNGLEPNNGSCVMQPVLQLGSANPAIGEEGVNGYLWTIYCYVCCPNNTNISPNCHGSGSLPIPVSPGDTITGTMALDQNSDVWTITTTDNTSDKFDTMSVSSADVGGPQTLAAGGVLETLDVTDCGYLPASGQLTFGSSTAAVNFGQLFAPDFLPHLTVVGPSNTNCREYAIGGTGGVSIYFSTGTVSTSPPPPAAPPSLPVIASVSSSVVQGQFVTLSGSGFLPHNVMWVTSQAGTNGLSVASSNGTTITFLASPSFFPIGTVMISIYNSNGKSVSVTTTVLAAGVAGPSPHPAPMPISSSDVVINNAPSSLIQGHLFTLSGSGFLSRNILWVTSQTGTNGLTVVSTDGTTITFSTPASVFTLGSVTLYLSNANGNSGSITLAVEP